MTAVSKYQELYDHPYFQELLKKTKDRCPIVPDFDPEDPNSGERMKALSLKRQGFLLALTLFTGETHD
jgi:hypothetical protein